MTLAETAVDIRVDKRNVDEALVDMLASTPPDAGPVAEAMRYAVLGAGQRLRPVLALRVGRLLGSRLDLVIRGAAAVEMFHCASLIVDDLPCMDDDSFRRGRPSVHRVFGEPVALLAGFGLVALAARCVIEDLADDNALRPMVCFQQSLLRALDCSQLTGGQALDLAAKTEGILSSRRLAEKKTAPLFALAAHAGALGAPDRDRRLVTRFGLEFGVLYQFLDDLSDGHLQSEHVFRAQEERTRDLLRPFGSRAAELIDMVEMLSARAAA